MSDTLPTIQAPDWELQDCVRCGAVKSGHLAAVWTGRGWHAFVMCLECEQGHFVSGDWRVRPDYLAAERRARLRALVEELVELVKREP